MLPCDPALTLAAASPLPPGSESALYEVLDRLGPSIFAGLLDTEGVLRYANQAALQAIGSTPDQVLGRRFDTTPWWHACEQSQRRLQQALASALRGEASRFDVRVATSSGATQAMDFSLMPLFGADGQVVGLIASARDVTERERAQHQLRLTRHAVEQANDALLQVGPDGAFRDANAAACRLLGLERDQLLRLRVPDIDTQTDEAQWPQRWRELCERGALRFETSVRHQEGHEIPADLSVSLVTSDGETFAHVCIDDLRERRAAERRIRQLLQFDELKGLRNASCSSSVWARSCRPAPRRWCWCWSSTVSSASTTAWASTSATRCCAKRRSASPPSCAASTWLRAAAATSS